MKKIKRKVSCSKCGMLRIIHYIPKNDKDKKEFIKSLFDYICSNCKNK